MLNIKGYEPDNFAWFSKGGETSPKSLRVLKPSDSEFKETNFRAFDLRSAKKWNFPFFAKRKITDLSGGLEMLGEGSFKSKLKNLVLFFKWPKRVEGNSATSPPFSCPKSSDQNFEIPILFIIDEKPNNYSFGYNMIPQSPRGKIFIVIKWNKIVK